MARAFEIISDATIKRMARLYLPQNLLIRYGGQDMSETILSAEDLRAIADLARLDLSDEDLQRYQQQLSAILGYFQKLEELDTSHIDPTSSVLPLTNVLRADVAGAALPLDEAVANAPDSDGEQFRVRAVLDSD